MQDGSDKRADVYGEPVETRARFLLEVVEAMVSVWGGNRVAVRIGPRGTLTECRTATRKFDYLAQQLNSFGLAYLHLIEPRIKGERSYEEDLPPVSVARLREIFEGEIIAAGGFAVVQRRWWKRETLTWSYFLDSR